MSSNADDDNNNTGSDGTWGELTGSGPPTPTHSTTTNTSEPATHNNGRWGSLSGDGPPTPTHTIVDNKWVRISDIQQHRTQQQQPQQQQPQQRGQQQQQTTHDNNKDDNGSDDNSSGDESSDDELMQATLGMMKDPNAETPFLRKEVKVAEDCGLKNFALKQCQTKALENKFNPSVDLSMRVPPHGKEKGYCLCPLKLSHISTIAAKHNITDFNLKAFYKSLPKGKEALDIAYEMGFPDGTAVIDNRTNTKKSGRSIFIYSSKGDMYKSLAQAACELDVDINKINDNEITKQLQAATDEKLPSGWLKISFHVTQVNYYNPKRDIMCSGHLGRINALTIAKVCNPHSINHKLVTKMMEAAQKFGDKMTAGEAYDVIINWSQNTPTVPPIKNKAKTLQYEIQKRSADTTIAITEFFKAGKYWEALQNFGVDEKHENNVHKMMASIMDETEVNNAITEQVHYTKYKNIRTKNTEKSAGKTTKKAATKKKKTKPKKNNDGSEEEPRTKKRGATRKKAPAKSSVDSESEEEPPSPNKKARRRGMQLPILMEAV